jgi:predicted PurR-regulated permease PerM
MADVSRLSRLLVMSACFVIVVAGMKAASSIIVLLLLAVFIAVIATPLLIAMQRRGIPTALSLLILILGIAVIGFGLIVVVGESFGRLSADLPEYQVKLQGYIDGTITWLQARGIEAPEKAVNEVLNSRTIINLVRGLLGSLSGLMSNASLILLIVIFLLLEAALLPEKVRTLPGLSDSNYAHLEKIVDDVRQYMGIKTMMSLLTGALVTVLLLAFGVRYAVLLGLLTFLLNYIPTIGSIMAAIPGILMALLQFGVGRAAIVAVGILVINVGVSNGIEPRLMGKKLGLSPVIIVVAMIFWGWVLGPVGMLLSIPLTMAAKIVMESWEETRWIAILMGTSAAKESK